MEAFSFLETTAEVAITFAGFISLFFVLATRDKALLPEIAVLIRFILLGSLIVLFLAALPCVLAGLGVGGASLWRTSGGAGLAVGVITGVFAANQRRSLTEREVTRLVPIAWLLALVSSLTHLSNIVGWPLPPGAGVHLAAIWMTLALASVNLIDLVFRFALEDPAA